jgi:hypothetical protein
MPVRVPKVPQAPHCCSFSLRADDPEGFFLGEILSGWDPKAAISVRFARTLARELGYVHPDDHKALSDEMDVLRAELDQANARIEELQGQFEAIDVLASAGFQARKKPGRKPGEAREKV